jgi:hypothetical protein
MINAEIDEMLQNEENDLNNTEDRRSAVKRLVSRPICHFTPMNLEFADDWPNGQVSFWECKHCGHTKEEGRNYPAC